MQKSRWFGAALVSMVAVIFQSSPTPAADRLEELGRNLSRKHCARCHVIDEKNLFCGISSTPSFSLLVNGLDDWRERFLSFHTRLPHPSVLRFKGEPVDPAVPFATVPMVLEHSDIEALAAYAESLKKSP